MSMPTLHPQGGVPRARAAALLVTLAAVVVAAPAAPAAAQDRLIGVRTAGAGPFFEVVSFGDDFTQPLIGGGTARLHKVTQLTLPVSVMVPLGPRFTVDVSGGFASGEVERTVGDNPRANWSLSGLADTKVRLTGRVAGDNVIFTLGANLPTGGTDLDTPEYEAARVLSAPALGLRVPVLGNGTGFTGGLVAARQVGALSLALGASYELRSGYSPTGVVAGIPAALEYNPSDAVRVALMGDVLVGQGQMTFGVSMDAFSEGEITTGGGAPQTLRLGPVVTGEWHWRLAPWRFRALDLSVVDRFRTEYERDGASVAGSDANYLDVALRGLLPLWRRTDLVVGLDARHQTGMDSDATIAAAAYAGGGLTLGVARELGNGFQLQPVVRVQFGSIESAGVSSSVTGFGAGVSVARRF